MFDHLIPTVDRSDLLQGAFLHRRLPVSADQSDFISQRVTGAAWSGAPAAATSCLGCSEQPPPTVGADGGPAQQPRAKKKSLQAQKLCTSKNGTIIQHRRYQLMLNPPFPSLCLSGGEDSGEMLASAVRNVHNSWVLEE